MSKSADLCRYDLPSGRTCRQPALKGEQGCRHHMRLFRYDETEMLHEEAMECLAAKLQSLDLPDLLHALYGKLTRLRSTVRANPEAQLALTITLDRLKQHGHNQRPAHPHYAHAQPAQNQAWSPSENSASNLPKASALYQGMASAMPDIAPEHMGFRLWPDLAQSEPTPQDSPEPSIESVNPQIAELLKILQNQ